MPQVDGQKHCLSPEREIEPWRALVSGTFSYLRSAGVSCSTETSMPLGVGVFVEGLTGKNLVPHTR